MTEVLLFGQHGQPSEKRCNTSGEHDETTPQVPSLHPVVRWLEKSNRMKKWVKKVARAVLQTRVIFNATSLNSLQYK